MFKPSAWVTRGALRRPEEFARSCAAMGLHSANIMLNDFSKARDPVPFEHHPTDQLVALAVALRAHGIDCTVTTWVMPHPDHIEGLVGTVPDLARLMGAKRIDLDAEEPWVRARDRLEYDEAAQRIIDGLAGHQVGLTGIASANVEALKPLADRCPVWLPQCYAHIGSDLEAESAVMVGVSKWRSKFGEPTQWIPGLAGWALGSPLVYMEPVVQQTVALGFSEGCYWTANQLEDNGPAVDFIRRSRRPAWLDIEERPSSEARTDVRRLQALLKDAGHDPGPIDGKPGPKTLAGLESFQRFESLPVTGVADRAVWWSLLG